MPNASEELKELRERFYDKMRHPDLRCAPMKVQPIPHNDCERKKIFSYADKSHFKMTDKDNRHFRPQRIPEPFHSMSLVWADRPALAAILAVQQAGYRRDLLWERG